jgi:hypothetical protein
MLIGLSKIKVAVEVAVEVDFLLRQSLQLRLITKV